MPARGPSSPLLRRLINGEARPALTAAQLRAFVEGEHHSVESLLAAWRLGDGSRAWLEEAAARHPDHPRVALAMLTAERKLPADASTWIARLQAAAPDNALGWTYAALQALQSGNEADGLQALSEAASRGKLDAYGAEDVAGLAAACKSAGCTDLEAQVLSTFARPLPHVTTLSDLAREIRGSPLLMEDAGTMQDMFRLAEALRGRGVSSLVEQLAAASIESQMIAGLEIYEPLPGTGLMAGEHLTRLEAERAAIRDLTRDMQEQLGTLTDTELKQYLRCLNLEGELKALQWLRRTTGTHAQ